MTEALNFHSFESEANERNAFMVKYTVMKFLVIVIAFLTSSAYAVKNVLPRPGDEGYADSEASTNEVFAVGMIFRFALL